MMLIVIPRAEQWGRRDVRERAGQQQYIARCFTSRRGGSLSFVPWAVLRFVCESYRIIFHRSLINRYVERRDSKTSKKKKTDRRKDCNGTTKKQQKNNFFSSLLRDSFGTSIKVNAYTLWQVSGGNNVLSSRLHYDDNDVPYLVSLSKWMECSAYWW